MINFRTIVEPNKNVFLTIERLDNGQFFDWGVGAFTVAVPTLGLFKPLTQNSTFPGRYTATSQHQQLGQFPIGTPLCFLVFRATGDATPTKSILWMDAAVVYQLPFNFSGSLNAAYITEPDSAF